MDPSGDGLLDHLEARLGEMADARIHDMERLGSISVLRFPGTPRPEATTYCTHGLSRAELHVAPGEHVRLEILCAVVGEPEPYQPDGWLWTLAEHFAMVQDPPQDLERHRFGPLFDGSRLEGGCLVETALVDGYDEPGADPVLIRELVPVDADEAGFVGDYGWAAFVDSAERAGTDLLDVRRGPVVVRTERAEPCPTCGRVDDYHLPDGTPVPDPHAAH